MILKGQTMETSVVYLIKASNFKIDGIVVKGGKAHNHTLEDRFKYASETIKSKNELVFDRWYAEVEGDGDWHERALLYALSLKLAPIMSKGGNQTEFFTAFYYTRENPSMNIFRWDNNNASDVMSLLSAIPPHGNYEAFGLYLASVFGGYTRKRSGRFPAYCYRDNKGVHIDLSRDRPSWAVERMRAKIRRTIK